MRILKFFNEQARKLPEDYNQFYKDYGIFLKEGIVANICSDEKVMSLRQVQHYIF